MAIHVVRTTYLHELDSERLEARPDHRAWLTSLKERGICINAGPLADDSGALLVFDVADGAALEAILAQDPYPKHTLEYHVLGEWKTLFPFA